jgi:hypothetical protein
VRCLEVISDASETLEAAARARRDGADCYADNVGPPAGALMADGGRLCPEGTLFGVAHAVGNGWQTGAAARHRPGLRLYQCGRTGVHERGHTIRTA